MTLKAGTTRSTGKHRNQTCRCTFSSYYCTRKPDYYRLSSRWSQRENFDVTNEKNPRSCRIVALWDKYNEEESTVNQLLKKCGNIYGSQ
jgi:hypothetical protein